MNKRAEHLVTLLHERGQTVATAESLTAGLVCATLTEIPGASAVVRGGLIVYATDLKQQLAGADPHLLQTSGAVHPEIARQLAQGARRQCHADWGVGLTGVAGPEPQDGFAPGIVHLGVAGDDVTTIRTLELTGDRSAIRMGSIRSALDLLGEHLM